MTQQKLDAFYRKPVHELSVDTSPIKLPFNRHVFLQQLSTRDEQEDQNTDNISFHSFKIVRSSDGLFESRRSQQLEPSGVDFYRAHGQEDSRRQRKISDFNLFNPIETKQNDPNQTENACRPLINNSLAANKPRKKPFKLDEYFKSVCEVEKVFLSE